MAAVELILKTLKQSKEFCDAEDKNWEAVAKLIPGATAQQVQISPDCPKYAAYFSYY